MNMTERVARILCQQADRDPDEVVAGEGRAIGVTWLAWEAFETNARAVLTALHEPDGAMKAAGAEFFEEGDAKQNGFAAAIVYQAMIDAALVE
jgi:hypothetical protein